MTLPRNFYLMPGLIWVQVGAMTEKDSLIRTAFREQQAERVLLKQGTELYKFNDAPFLTNREGERGSRVDGGSRIDH